MVAVLLYRYCTAARYHPCARARQTSEKCLASTRGTSSDDPSPMSLGALSATWLGDHRVDWTSRVGLITGCMAAAAGPMGLIGG